MKIPSPHQVCLMQNDVARAVLDEITNKLSDVEWVKNNKGGTEADPFWIISKEGFVTDEDKALITKELVDAGWKRVVVKNSREIYPPEYANQQPGLIKIAVFVNAVNPKTLKEIEGLLGSVVKFGELRAEPDPNAHRTFFRPRN